ncbi:hypothetical protein BD310DRAFT_68942 [Dichomitus squalens]|uniref:Uncharacterized protein n=1 Tax=Dichomitus squalens TaxID=114155 RepID=A0A4Q9PK70_9APHY|nr:hypothetical protein BD310DRAFT_68942 [Dichomitus squalens]
MALHPAHSQSRHSRKRALARTAGIVLLSSTLLLYTSTTIYMAALAWNATSFSSAVTGAADNLFSVTYDGRESILALSEAADKQSRMLTAALSVNVSRVATVRCAWSAEHCAVQVMIGDAVVWWRACFIWQNRLINCLGPLLLTLTLVFGAVGLALSPAPGGIALTVYFGSNGFVDACAILSFGTNVIATSLIAYKAWAHRRFLKKYLGADGMKSRVFRMLALLVESGIVYIAVLAFSVMYQLNPASYESLQQQGALVETEDVFTYGCLVPVAAIYPTFIIVLVALEQSPIAGGLSKASKTQDPEKLDGITTSTIIFHNSTFRSPDSEDDSNALESGACSSNVVPDD